MAVTLNHIPIELFAHSLEIADGNPNCRLVNKYFKKAADHNFNGKWSAFLRMNASVISGVFARLGGIGDLSTFIKNIESYYDGESAVVKMGVLAASLGFRKIKISHLCRISQTQLSNLNYKFVLSLINTTLVEDALTRSLTPVELAKLDACIYIYARCPKTTEPFVGYEQRCKDMQRLEKALYALNIFQL